MRLVKRVLRNPMAATIVMAEKRQEEIMMWGESGGRYIPRTKATPLGRLGRARAVRGSQHEVVS